MFSSPPEPAAALPVAGCTALQGLRDRAHLQPGQRVLIYGAGGVFDIGANRSFADCRRVLAPNGTHVLVGAPSGAWAVLSRLLKAQLLSRMGRQRIASFLARVRHEDLVVLKGLVEAGNLSPVIDRRYPLSEVPDAVRYLGTGDARGKVVIRVG